MKSIVLIVEVIVSDVQVHLLERSSRVYNVVETLSGDWIILIVGNSIIDDIKSTHCLSFTICIRLHRSYDSISWRVKDKIYYLISFKSQVSQCISKADKNVSDLFIFSSKIVISPNMNTAFCIVIITIVVTQHRTESHAVIIHVKVILLYNTILREKEECESSFQLNVALGHFKSCPILKIIHN